MRQRNSLTKCPKLRACSPCHYNQETYEHTKQVQIQKSAEHVMDKVMAWFEGLSERGNIKAHSRSAATAG
jgi:hypothetical protein